MAVFADRVLSRLKETPTFRPTSVNTFGDWSIEAGDVITATVDGKTHCVPVFTADTWWNGAAATTLAASGNVKREVQRKRDRKEYSAQSATLGRFGGVGQRLDKLNEDYLALTVEVGDSIAGLKLYVEDNYYTKTAAAQVFATIDDMTAGLSAKVNSTEMDNYYTKTAAAQVFATIDDMTAGLSAKVNSTEMDNYYTKTAAAQVFATVDDISAEIGVYAAKDSAGNSMTLAEIVANVTQIKSDITTIQGDLNVGGKIFATEGGIGTTGAIHAGGGLYATGLTITGDYFMYGANKFSPTSITSSNGSSRTVLGGA